jgi:hypothetical protein
MNMKITRNLAAIAAATSLLAAQPAQACWSDRETQAASVANLNMMMMVTALRCRKGPDNFLAEYNRFVTTNNGTLGLQNAVIKSRFARMNGAQAAEGAMDRFTIGLANSYGGSSADRGCGELKLLAVDLASRSHDSTALAAMADRHAGVPALPGGQCGAKVAAR